MAALNEKLETINRVVRQTAAAQQLEGEKLEVAASDSQRVESKAPAIDELSLDNEETDDNRNKRWQLLIDLFDLYFVFNFVFFVLFVDSWALDSEDQVVQVVVDQATFYSILFAWVLIFTNVIRNKIRINPPAELNVSQCRGQCVV